MQVSESSAERMDTECLHVHNLDDHSYVYMYVYMCVNTFVCCTRANVTVRPFQDASCCQAALS